jgi:hypothetical protein
VLLVIEKTTIRMPKFNQGFSTFISFKFSRDGELTPDYVLAKDLYDQLVAKDLHAFFSPITLRQISQSDYRSLINRALDEAKVLVVVGTSTDNINSKWVSYEWSSFVNDIQSDIKTDVNIYTLTRFLAPKDLPRELRQYSNFDETSINILVDQIAKVLLTGAAADISSPSGHSPSSDPIRTPFASFYRDPTADDCGDLVRAFATRADAESSLKLSRLIEQAEIIEASGISLNVLSLQTNTQKIQDMLSRDARIHALFLDPESEAMQRREAEERHRPGKLARLTQLNIDSILDLRESLPPKAKDNLAIRLNSEPVTNNMLFLDGRLCVVQPYLTNGRGIDCPTFVLVNRFNDGIFNIYHQTYSHLWELGRPL